MTQSRGCAATRAGNECGATPGWPAGLVMHQTPMTGTRYRLAGGTTYNDGHGARARAPEYERAIQY